MGPTVRNSKLISKKIVIRIVASGQLVCESITQNFEKKTLHEL
jgi:hypothetical protein